MPSDVQPKTAKVKANAYPVWSPRFWHGMRTACWWRLLARNHFRIALGRLHLALGVTLFTPVNDLLAIVQAVIYGRRIRRTKVEKSPVFILGHWRSGTTLLHEMLVSDPQFASPNTYQCFAPAHFIVSEWLMVRLGHFLLPKKRPMDNMDAGWELPQEDEFALMNLGIPTPYLRVAFPRTQPKAFEYLSLTDLSDKQRRRWRDGFLWFVKALSFHHRGKQLVLKSPPHTGRLAELNRLFPDAKFIHLTRDPRKLFTSTMRLWQSLDEVQALQSSPSEDELGNYVFECLERMYDGYEQAREAVGSDRLVDVSYEELVADPMGTLRDLYNQLQLGDFESVAPYFQQRLEKHDDYRPNYHRMEPELEQRILQQWSDYAARYDYASQLESSECATRARG